MIELRETEDMGGGVFATRHIYPNKLILKNNATPFNEREWQAIKQTPIGPMLFVARKGKGCFAAWGDITLVNHSDNPNADIDTAEVDGRLVVMLVATKRIKPGQQIFISYANIGDVGTYPWYKNLSTSGWAPTLVS